MMALDNAQLIDDTTYWEEVARTTWGTYVTDIERQAILRAHKLCIKPATALEIGVEGGRWSTMLADLGWSMICTDINDETLATCKKRIPTANCILVKPEERRLPCESESISLLLCIEVAPVIQSDWFTDETFRVLKDDGLVVGVFWNSLSFRGCLARTKACLAGKFDFYRFSYPSWRKKLSEAGYSFLYEEGYCWFPFSRESNSRFVPAFVRLEKWLRLGKLVFMSPWIVFIARKRPKNIS